MRKQFKDFTFAFPGQVWAMVPQEGNYRMFRTFGIGTGRIEEVPEGWRIYNREVLYYLDPDTGASVLGRFGVDGTVRRFTVAPSASATACSRSRRRSHRTGRSGCPWPSMGSWTRSPGSKPATASS